MKQYHKNTAQCNIWFYVKHDKFNFSELKLGQFFKLNCSGFVFRKNKKFLKSIFMYSHEQIVRQAINQTSFPLPVLHPICLHT